MKHLAGILFALACGLAALAPLAGRGAPSSLEADAFAGWPASFEDRPLKELPLSPVEQRFGDQFPGRVARFTDGNREIIMRWVAEGTRKLHPASDCFKANGYAIAPLPIKVAGKQRWSGFVATRGTQALEVRERIYDASGAQWSDVSAWYWAVQLGQTSGPWWAVTVAQAQAK